MQVKLVTMTSGFGDFAGRTIDEIIVGQARVSSGKVGDELFDNPAKLLRHCIINGHWSVFATANLGFEITTSRAIGRELLRHWSLRPQEFSQRYATQLEHEPVELRVQGTGNRQSSSVRMEDEELDLLVQNQIDSAFKTYSELLSRGVAREVARFLLPECTQTKLYLNGTVREWITMLNFRLHHTTQGECRLVAEAIRNVLLEQCPIVCSALFNFEGADQIHILDQVILEKYGVFDAVVTGGVGDMVNHPPHYQRPSPKTLPILRGLGVPEPLFNLQCRQALKVLECDHGWGFSLLSAMKYLWRCEFKGRFRQDLEKARWYLTEVSGDEHVDAALISIGELLSKN